MSLHLAEISLAIEPGAHGVLLMDQAGWHMTRKLEVPDNISIVPLPPKCPELNPVENLWQFMRDNWLSNRIFTSHENIIDLCCEAWNRLVDQPWRIMNIGRRKWGAWVVINACWYYAECRSALTTVQAFVTNRWVDYHAHPLRCEIAACRHGHANLPEGDGSNE